MCVHVCGCVDWIWNSCHLWLRCLNFLKRQGWRCHSQLSDREPKRGVIVCVCVLCVRVPVLFEILLICYLTPSKKTQSGSEKIETERWMKGRCSFFSPSLCLHSSSWLGPTGGTQGYGHLQPRDKDVSKWWWDIRSAESEKRHENESFWFRVSNLKHTCFKCHISMDLNFSI